MPTEVMTFPTIVDSMDLGAMCPKCNMAAATIHWEKWSDDFVYKDISCAACGFSEVST